MCYESWVFKIYISGLTDTGVILKMLATISTHLNFKYLSFVN